MALHRKQRRGRRTEGRPFEARDGGRAFDLRLSVVARAGPDDASDGRRVGGPALPSSDGGGLSAGDSESTWGP